MDRPDRDRGRRLRLVGGVVTTAAGVAALLALWFLPPAAPVEDRLAGWVGAFAALVAVLHGVPLLVKLAATIVMLAIACYVLALIARPLLGRTRRHGGPHGADRLHDIEDDLQLRGA